MRSSTERCAAIGRDIRFTLDHLVLVGESIGPLAEELVSRAEDGGAYAHDGGALFDGDGEVVAHAHAELG